ncbi:protein NEDD1-like [Gossypium arboreum]|uniref:protein NEDD1-like n=1 Tax=Gossypium arboreum TaxID=29729 RepID=UPI0022F174D0|nr:protein NEDD1-like [Gossypium arboreum]
MGDKISKPQEIFRIESKSCFQIPHWLPYKIDKSKMACEEKISYIIASVGLDKKLYTYDSGFSSLAFKDDGWTLAAGTGNGRVVFCDIRGKLQPFTVLRAYSSSDIMFYNGTNDINWMSLLACLCSNFKVFCVNGKSKPAIVNESTCTAETALLGGAMEDSVLMPDPLPSDVTKSFTALESTPTPSSKSEETSITSPEALGGDKISDKFAQLRQLPSLFGMPASGGLTTSSIYAGQDQSSMLSQTSSNLSYENLHPKDVSSNQEISSLGFPEHFSSSSMSALSFGSKGITRAGSLDSPKLASLAPPRRFSTYAERISTTSAFSDGTSHLVASPKTKKTGAETREELFNSLLSRSDSLTAAASGVLPAMNV